MSTIGVLSLGGAAMLGFMAVVWVVSVVVRDASIIDIAWGPNFVLISWVAVAVADGDRWRGALLTAMVTVWGLRLALHLAVRNLGHGEDPRYRAMRRYWGDRFWIVSLGTVFALQGVLAWIVALPVQLGSSVQDPGNRAVMWLGVAVFSLGLAFETIGDLQLTRFRNDPTTRGQVLDRGLWRYTRHPNYFGDAVAWWGIALVGASAGGVAVVGLAGALVMTLLLLKVSGVPLLERSMAERRPGYAEYVATTSSFVPWPKRTP